MELAFQDFSKMDVKDFTYLCEGWDVQLRQHFCPAWGLEHWPCAGYSDLTKLSPGSFYAMGILNKLEEEGVAGYHTAFLGLAYARIRRGSFFDTAISGSHENCETRLNVLCDKWIQLADGSGRSVAFEACDPCEGDSYEVEVDIFGEKRKIPVSDFVLPSYFDPNGKRPFTFMDTIDKSVHKLGLSRNGGGYLLLRDKNGNTSDYWGTRFMGMLKKPRPNLWNKASDPLSRSAKLLKTNSKVLKHTEISLRK